ncbi:MAG: TIGR03905 family TSCPD domain-containing protein [Lachnospiraceae bacterium]|nr:TIGR03905 family TSCPD domain-containing protein [Lachnospiraceae bacterium]
MHFKPTGICAIGIDFEVVDDRVYDVRFTGGCDGNHKGLAALIEGMPVQEAIDRLSGITCGPRSTSCPDQLARALQEYSSKKAV